jgi:GAF domain-containing protein
MRAPTQGLAAKSCNLPIFIEVEREGVCAKTVREKKAFLIDDVTVKEPDTDTDKGIDWPEIYVESTPNIRSELCVPLLISAPPLALSIWNIKQ